MKTLRLVVLLAFSLCFAVQATAQDRQAELVVDDAGVFGSGLNQVVQAAQELTGKGADVHVWTIKSFAGEAGNLDAYYNKLEKSFPAWQSPEGGRKNNLIVMMISIKERKTGLYYGSEWGVPLKKSWLRIQTDLMNPKFKRKEFAGGFSAGLGEISRLLDGHLHPQATPNTPQTIVIQPQAPLAQATDLTGLWSVLKWIAILAFICVAGFFGMQFIISGKKQKESKLGAQQKAKIEKANVTKKVSAIREKMTALEPLAAVVGGSVDSKTAAELRSRFEKVKKLQAVLAESFTAADNSAGNPDNNDFSVAQYQAIEKKYAEVSSSANEVLSEVDELQTGLTAMRNLAMNAPKAKEVLEKKIAAAVLAVGAVTQQGFKIDAANKSLDAAKKLFNDLQVFLAEKLYSEIAKTVAMAENKVAEAVKNAVDLPALKEKLEKTADELEQRIVTITAHISEGREAFRRISSAYVPRSWESIKGNGTEAEKRIARTTAAIAEIKRCSSMEVQDWTQAGEQAKKAADWLDQAESFMQSILALEKNLKVAKANVAKEIAHAESDIKKASAYIKQYDADVRDDLEDSLRKAAAIIEETKNELKQAMPGYTGAFRQAQQVNLLIDQAYELAVNEHEAAERQRRKLETQRVNAERKLSKAREYFQDHGSDISSRARASLQTAEEAVQKARNGNGSDLVALTALMLLAEEHADNAYQYARDDVGESRRERHVSNWGSHDNSPSYSGHGSSNHRDSDDGGGGGSSSFGSSFDSGSSGGGSSNFGGSSDCGGGGGSSDW